MTNTESDERRAVAQLKRGKVSGLEILVRLYQVPALRAAFLVLCDRAQADDIVQAAFLRAYDRIHQFDESRPFGPWFLRSVLNDAVKAAGRQARQVSLDGNEQDESVLADMLADPSPGPEVQMETAERCQAVWRALGQLAPAQRGAIVQRYYLGLSESEMAAHSGSPPGTIKWRLHSARERLRGLLWTLVPGPGPARRDRSAHTLQEANDE
jgi:RNA polymerase sigma-70 factor, ECF subfamily